jgi:hypothetical protein
MTKKRYWTNECRHFTNGVDVLHGKCCLLGIPYESVTAKPNENGSVYRLACHTPADGHGLKILQETGPAGCCDKHSPWTEEELQQREAESDAAFAESMRRMQLVAPIISAMKKKYKGKTVKGTKTCPVCGGKLHLSHAGYNGHVWGKCETAGCLNWME